MTDVTDMTDTVVLQDVIFSHRLTDVYKPVEHFFLVAYSRYVKLHVTPPSKSPMLCILQ